MKPKQEIWQWHSWSSNLSQCARSNIHYYIARGLPIWILASSSVRMIKMDPNSKLPSAPVQLMHSGAGCNLGLPPRFCCQFTLKQTGIYSAATFFGFRTGRRYGGERSWRGELGFCFTACTSQAHVMPWVRTLLCKNWHLYSSIKWWLPCPLGWGWCSETRDPKQENVADRPSNLLAKAWKTQRKHVTMDWKRFTTHWQTQLPCSFIE